MKSTVLIIGSGGREHAFGWKLKQSPHVEKVYFAPGNGGTQQLGENVPIAAEDIEKLCDWAKKNHIDLTVVGPEVPLSLGIVDYFQKHKLLIFGPTQAAAQLESSKVWASAFLQRHHIPQPRAAAFADPDKAIAFIRTFKIPPVIKASGLAAGKGVIIPATIKEAIAAVKQIMVQKQFGHAGDEVLIQERLSGPEVSVIAFTDGKTIKPLLAAQDHKRVFDGDQGLNTGGMGAYAPTPFMTPTLLKTVVKTILQPTIDGMRAEGHPYRGVLFAGLMLTSDGPKVLEFNARSGDPETQPLLLLLKSDLYPILKACVKENLNKVRVSFRKGTAICIVLCAKGYPGLYEKGAVIKGLDSIKGPDVQVFHAGTSVKNGKIISTGGRVIGLTVYAPTFQAARDKAYQIIGRHRLNFRHMHYRTDIGKQATT